MDEHAEDRSVEPIAVIGMAGRFPGARSVAQLWENLRAGVESIRRFSPEELRRAGVPEEYIEDPDYVSARGVLDDVDQFDASFFGFAPREAELLDPQLRIFLECAWEALEDAGYDCRRVERRVGVFAGTSRSTYFTNNLLPNRSRLDPSAGLQLEIGNGHDFLTSWVSYKLDLKGPSVDVQTACSTSLVAVHLACQSLLNHECAMALAGGVSVRIPQTRGYFHYQGGIYSPDGRCRSFDAAGQGTLSSNAAGTVVLKRLADALANGDPVRAVIRGSSVNNDGALKLGFTAPNGAGQEEAIREALGVAGVPPDSIGLIEAHATATPLGDPAEIAALCRAFRSEKRNYCALGSIKSNLGHLDQAAGVAGLIKAVLALEHRELPPTLHFTGCSPEIDLEHSPFFVNTALRPWVQAGTRRAGVSSFGVGGTNAHVVLEEAPRRASPTPDRPAELLVLAARSESALGRIASNLAVHLRAHPDLPLADVAHTLQMGRRPFEYRRAIACRSREEAIRALEDGGPRELDFRGRSESRRVVFLLPGEGAQHIGMGEELYRTEPVFRACVDRCAERLAVPLRCDIRCLLYPALHPSLPPGSNDGESPVLDRADLAQPALFTVEYALAELEHSFGVTPDALLGYGLGEYVAACLAGVMSLEVALEIVCARARLIRATQSGAMLAVMASSTRVERFLRGRLALAAVDSAVQCVVSGPSGEVAALRRELASVEISSSLLRASHAFQSPTMESVVAPLRALTESVSLAAPRIPFLSNVSGTWITDEQARAPDYWARHPCRTLRFSDCVGSALEHPSVFLDLGPGGELSAHVRQHPRCSRDVSVAVALPPRAGDGQSHGTGQLYVLGALGCLWASGVEPAWERTRSAQRPRRVALPTYPFERSRFWIDAAPAPPPPEDSVRGPRTALPVEHTRPELVQPYVSPRQELEAAVAVIWGDVLGIRDVGAADNFFDLGGNSVLAIQVTSRVRKELALPVVLSSIFEAPTVAEYAEAIGLFGAGDAPGENDAALREIESLPDEEVERLLALEGGHAQLEERRVPSDEAAPEARVGNRGSNGTVVARVPHEVSFSLSFFSQGDSKPGAPKYELLTSAARFADEAGFLAIWTPERHFQSFGGLYPNPSVLGAAIAMVTKRIRIRAGSVVLPLHHPLRVAEEWSVVDNLSGGRVGISIATGWHKHDFVLGHTEYAQRRSQTFEAIQTLRDLWAGRAVEFQNDEGETYRLCSMPRPIQRELPLWITCGGSAETWRRAGELGANVLTMLGTRSVRDLAESIRAYRQELARHGYDANRTTVTVMLHSFVGRDDDEVRELVRKPMLDYLASYVRQYETNPDKSSPHALETALTPADQGSLLDGAFERYFAGSALLGSIDKCRALAQELRAAGVGEIGCLIDFGLETETVLASLPRLNELRTAFEAPIAP